MDRVSWDAAERAICRTIVFSVISSTMLLGSAAFGVRVVDASGTVDEVYARVMDVISEVVPGLRGRIEDV